MKTVMDLLKAFNSVEGIEQGFDDKESKHIIDTLWGIPVVGSLNDTMVKDIVIVYKNVMYAVNVPMWHYQRKTSALSIMNVKWKFSVELTTPDCSKLINTHAGRMLYIDLDQMTNMLGA